MVRLANVALTPRANTCGAVGMSALGQKQTCAVHKLMSAMGQKRTYMVRKDMSGATSDVSYGPESNISGAAAREVLRKNVADGQ